MATASAIVGVVTSVASYSQTRKGQKARERKAAAQTAKSRRKTVARGRVLQAQTEAQAVNQGVGGSSSAQGAAGSIQTQTANAIGFSNQMQRYDRKANQYDKRAAGYRTFGQIAQTGGDTTMKLMPGMA